MPRSSNSHGSDTQSASRPVSPGVISTLEVYRIDEAKRRLGWTDSALRAAKRRGLKVLASGKRRYVTGTEILRFLESENGGGSDDSKS